jgi:UDP-N-acetyl-D-mannosaminuronic acid dehydrogenase
MSSFTRDVCVIGGGGHVGLPLALILAESGFKTVIYDTNVKTVETIRCGEMPFTEHGGPEMLKSVLAKGTLEISATPELVKSSRYLVLVIGTPVDEHLNPSFTGIQRVLNGLMKHMVDGQTLILRSTVFPGITEHVQRLFERAGLKIDVAFCPERVAEGFSIREFRQLPQIIGADDPKIFADVRKLFEPFTAEIIEMSPMEAELCKLMTNAWRYIQFAAINQFYMIASERGLDFNKILHGCRYKYPRTAGMPGPGFAAGPCLVKDTMQLAAFSTNAFPLGHAAMVINEGLPAHLIDLAKKQTSLSDKVTGILGMAFKAESDDPRDSLSYKLRKRLMLESSKVICTDPYVTDPSFMPLEHLLKEADVLFLAVPHKLYRDLKPRKNQIVIDPWDCINKTEV